MARPTARVLSLLAILQSGGTHSAADLAGRLEVDERTVRRYVEHLVELDVPVEPVRGRYGGYRLRPGYRMPPLMLTEEEALAVMLGLVAAARSGMVPTSAGASEAAAVKLRRVLPADLANRLDGLVQSFGPDDGRVDRAAPQAGVLLLLAEAARDRRPVAFLHESREGRQTARTLWPYGVVANSGRWYVVGLDADGGEQRTFRLDRLAMPRLLPGQFEVPEGFDATDAVHDSLAATPWRHRVALRVLATPDQVRRQFPARLAALDDLGSGWLRLRLRVERLDWLPGLLAALDQPFVIEEPEELRDEVGATADRLSAYADAR